MAEIKGLEGMRLPFREDEILKMCRPTKKDNAKGNCPKCGGYHGLPAIQLDYVGHAALTNRLLDCDPNWTWEPLAYDEKGLPLRDSVGGLWIKLTVCGVTRLGYGDAQGKMGGDAVKECIGDALRNAAMRFGAALDLWHKGNIPLFQPDDLPGHHAWTQDDVDAATLALDHFTEAWDKLAENDPSMLQVDRNTVLQRLYALMQTKSPTEWHEEVKAVMPRAPKAQAGWTSDDTAYYMRLLGDAQTLFLKAGKSNEDFQTWAEKYRAKQGQGDAKAAISEMEGKVKAMQRKK